MTGRCRVVLAGAKCFEPGTYIVHLADCPVCAGLGWLFCIGHTMCIEHGAGMRGDAYVYPDNDGPVDVTAERIQAVYPVAAELDREQRRAVAS